MELRKRFVLPLVVVALVLSLTTVVGYTLYRDAVVDSQRGDLGRTSESVAAQLDLFLEEKQQTVRLQAQDEALRAHGTDRQAAALSSFVQSTSFSGASVIAANGTMTAINSQGLDDSRGRTLVGQSFGDRAYFQRSMAGESYVSDPVDADSGFLIVTVSTPIRADGEVVGVFAGAFHIREGDFTDVVRTSTTPARGTHVYADGTTVFGQGPSPTDEGRRMVVNATVPSTGWTVSATTTEGALESRLWTVALVQLGVFSLVVLGLVGFGWWVSREYIGNVGRLSDGFASLADGDYGTRVALSGATEWDRLETSFNELSETLARRRTEVTVLNRVLRHNLRNAMTVVVGSADRIAATTDDDDIADDAARIHRRGESLLALANHARAIESSLGRRDEDVAVRRVDALVEEVATVLADEFPQATVTSDVGAAADARVPSGDLLVVVLDELGRNGILHDDTDDPRVDFTASASADTVTLTVSDDGPGLPPIERRVLTEPFVETPTQHSSGLGLWLVTWLIARVDGEIDVTAAAGTRVRVTVPRVTGDPDAGDSRDPPPTDSAIQSADGASADNQSRDE
jgi:signal transduction histidine kinase